MPTIFLEKRLEVFSESLTPQSPSSGKSSPDVSAGAWYFRDRIFEILEEILDLGGEETVELLDKLFDIVLSEAILPPLIL